MLTVPGQTTHPRMLRAQTIVKRAKDGLRTHMGGGANGKLDAEQAAGLRGCMDDLNQALQGLVGSGFDGTLHQEVSEMFQNELSPYLGRVPLMVALSANSNGKVVDEAVHTAWTQTIEDGTAVAVLDQWLRTQPSMNAIANVSDACMEAAGRLADDVVDGPMWVLGADHPAVALAMQQTDRVRSTIPVAWSPVQSLPEPEEAPAIVVVPALLEGLPDRHAIRLLSGLRSALKPGGRLVASALVPSADQAFTELVLGWSTHRRKPAQLLDLFILAGMAIVADAPSPQPGLVVIAQDKADAMSNPTEA